MVSESCALVGMEQQAQPQPLDEWSTVAKSHGWVLWDWFPVNIEQRAFHQIGTGELSPPTWGVSIQL